METKIKTLRTLYNAVKELVKESTSYIEVTSKIDSSGNLSFSLYADGMAYTSGTSPEVALDLLKGKIAGTQTDFSLEEPIEPAVQADMFTETDYVPLPPDFYAAPSVNVNPEDLQSEEHPTPLLVFNGTVEPDGTRFIPNDLLF